STLQRKNPLGLLEAFKRAFAPGEGPHLLLKSFNGDYKPERLVQLREAAGDRPDVHVVDQFVPEAERAALMAACDCYVSLHRSEGFGLTLGEAMALGKPVIGTGYSSNLDFMSSENSYLVRYEMTDVGPEGENYPAEGRWAEPDLDHAAQLMREVWEDREGAARPRRLAGRSHPRRPRGDRAARGSRRSRARRANRAAQARRARHGGSRPRRLPARSGRLGVRPPDGGAPRERAAGDDERRDRRGSRRRAPAGERRADRRRLPTLRAPGRAHALSLPPANATGRYAPSPTGTLHLGNLRTALLAWLFARSQNARFLMRIDDLDSGRVRPGVAEQQLADLAALGLDWDGPAVRQSERRELYREALEKLAAGDHLYACYCTRAEIREAASAPHGALPEGAYPGTCRELTRAQRAARERAGRPPALRLRAAETAVSFTDRLLGRFVGVVDDLVVCRNDGAPAYNLAVVVDDTAQGVGEVVRGADLIETTPRQLHVAARLELPAPSYAHVPLVLGADGARLAKRHGAVTLADRVRAGDSPEDVRSALARSVGLAAAGETPTLDELLARFDPARIPTEPTVLVT
ncbi:MAG: tRNA glutamyl-Q(34) synthetase GluQRS, partial [Actinobacteria bacterium]|nr:tRNA glutamyl-Q(34) synthetase GluQRS [Actinomycetota bacterium]